MHRRTLLRAAGALSTASLAGCLGDGGGATGGGDPSPDAQEYGDWLDDAGGNREPVDRTGNDRVTVEVGAGDGFTFDPAGVEVSPDATVVWEWTGQGGQHNVVHQGGDFRTDLVATAGYTFEQAFRRVGVYRYYCKPHRSLGMKGTVRVVE